MREVVTFSNNRKISVRQIRRTMTLEMLGVSTLLLPGYLAANGGTDGIFAMALGGAGALFLLLLWNKFAVKQNFYQALDRCGAGVRLVFSVFYGGALLGIAGYVLYLLTRLVVEQLLKAKYEPVILITLTAAAVFALVRGMESRVRVYEVLFWFLMAPLLVILCLACASVNVDYWPPIVTAAPAAFAKSAYVSFLFFSLSSLFLLFQPHCSKPKKAVGGVKASLFIVIVLNIAIYLILIGIFQTGLLAQLPFPIITLMAVVKLPGEFFERQDAFMVGIWFFCLFSLLNSMLFYGKEMLQNGIRAIRNKTSSAQNGRRSAKADYLWSCFSGAAILLLAAAFLHTGMSPSCFFKVYICGICPVMLLIPVFIFLAGKRKGGAE